MINLKNKAAVRKLAAREFTSAAFSAAGGLVILQQFGGFGNARIASTASDDPLQRAWTGIVNAQILPHVYALSATYRRSRAIVATPKRWEGVLNAAFHVSGCMGTGMAKHAALEQAQLQPERIYTSLNEEDLELDRLMQVPDKDFAVAHHYLTVFWDKVERGANKMMFDWNNAQAEADAYSAAIRTAH